MAEVPQTFTIRRLLSPRDWKDKQIATLKAVGKKNYITGIANPERSPIEAGSSNESEEKFNVSMQAALEKKSRQKGVAASSDSEWFGYSINIGADKLVDGVVKREAKVLDHITDFHPKLESHLADIDKLPTTTITERGEKMLANMLGLAGLHGSTKGR